MTDGGSSSLHSSRASMMTRVEMPVAELLHLRTEGSLSGIETPGKTPFGDAGTDRRAERQVLGRIAAVLQVPWAEEASPELSVHEDHPDGRLGGGSFFGSSRPFSQKMRWPCSLVSQCSISPMTSLLVTLIYPCLFPHRCPGFAACQILSRGARSADSYSSLCAAAPTSVVDSVWRGGQLSRIKQRPPATDLNGLKASTESLTPRRSNLAEADEIDFQSDLFSPTAASAHVLSGLCPPPPRGRVNFFFSLENDSRMPHTDVGCAQTSTDGSCRCDSG